MEDPLQDSKVALRQAQRRIAELDASIVQFVNAKPYAIVVEPNPQAGEDVHKMVMTGPLPDDLPHIAFEIVSHLRAALDRACSAVARAAQRRGKKAHFPFGDTPAEVESRRGSGSKELPREIFDVIVALQPYAGGNQFLFVLNKLCNANKHEILVPCVVAVAPTEIHMQRVTMRGSGVFPPEWDSTKNEMVIMVVPHGHQPQYQLKFAGRVAIRDAGDLSRYPATDVFGAMLREVERSLVAIEGEARRIGLFS